MTREELWNEFCAWSGEDPEQAHEAWAFGGDPDGLAELVIRGRKTATASLKLLYQIEQEPLPRAGEFSVITDGAGEAVCVIRTTRVYAVPFRDVGPAQAFREGEGDRSLRAWREIHRSFFAEELAPYHRAFDESMEVVCEEFEPVYAAER